MPDNSEATNPDHSSLFNRNHGEVGRTRYAITKAQKQETPTSGQVITGVKDAYQGLRTNDNRVQRFRNGCLDGARKSRDISQYAGRRGASSFRAAEIAYRRTLAAYLLAFEHLRPAVETRSLA
jgi:hypothetical protein